MLPQMASAYASVVDYVGLLLCFTTSWLNQSVCLSTRRLKRIPHTQAVVFTPSVKPFNVPINSVSHLISPCCLVERLWWKPDDFFCFQLLPQQWVSEWVNETWTHLLSNANLQGVQRQTYICEDDEQISFPDVWKTTHGFPFLGGLFSCSRSLFPCYTCLFVLNTE